MMWTVLLFDVTLPGGGIIFAAIGVAFFFVLATVAFLAFWLLRRTLRMAFRMAIVSAVLIVALIGGVSFIFLGAGSSPPPRRPEPTKR